MTELLRQLRHRIPTRRTWLVFLVHAAAFFGAYVAAYLLRFGLPIPNYYVKVFWISLPVLLALKLTIFYSLGHWKLGWRRASFSDLSALLRAATVASLVLATFDLMVSRYNIPRRILAIDWLLTIMILGGLRSIWRLSNEELRSIMAPKGCRKALIVGAGVTGESLARQFLHDRSLNYLAVGFLDDEARLGSRLCGVRVLGRPEDAVAVARQVAAGDVLVISGQLSGPRLRSLMEACAEANLRLKVIPAVDELLNEQYTFQIRDVDINDLLRREPVELSSGEIHNLLAHETVMVTGAGGSIGAEICRQVVKFEPRRLVLVERAENNLFQIDREFRERNLAVEIVPVLADIADRARMARIFEQYRPGVVFHAAAHKHVPLVEENPGEAIKNNVLGTAQLAELAQEFGVDEFVLISTDKSVNPTSVMGVSKQLAERFVHACSELGQTKFVVVRFGNVLASAGSVVPIFQEQVRKGGPITITHPEIERFFMTIPEASQLVLQAAAMGSGGEIYVLDMGEPVRIVDLARDMIRLSGLNPDEIEIKFIGLRPGEKLFEELYFKDERMLETPHAKVFVAYHRPYQLDEVRRTIEHLRSLADGPADLLREALARLVPEYQEHNGGEAGAALDSGAAPISGPSPRQPS